MLVALECGRVLSDLQTHKDKRQDYANGGDQLRNRDYCVPVQLNVRQEVNEGDVSVIAHFGNAHVELPPRVRFPFLREQAPRWGTVLNTVFRCAEETRRRGRGRDA